MTKCATLKSSPAVFFLAVSLFAVNEEQGYEVVKLQKFLTQKLSEFLDSKINYQMRRLKGKEREDLYVGPDFYEEKDLIDCKLLLKLFIFVIQVL